MKYNPAYPYHVTMAKHAPYVATAKSVKATRPGRTDGPSRWTPAINPTSGMGRNSPLPGLADADAPTDSTPGKRVAWKFKWGYRDHHAVNTVPKECLIRITKAEDGGIGARGPWEPVPASPRVRRTSS